MKRRRSVSKRKASSRRIVLQRQAMRDIDGRLAAAARPAPGQQRSLFGQRLGLDKQLVERRMLPVRIVRRQRQFDVTGQLRAGGCARND